MIAILQEPSTMPRKPALFTSPEVAETLGVTRDRVLQIAKARKLGRKLGDQWVFTPAEVEQMRVRKPGRPRVHPVETTLPEDSE